MHDRRDGVEEGQCGFVGQAADGVRQRRRGEGAGRDDDLSPVRRRQAGDFLAADGDQRVGFQGASHRGGKAVAIDRQRAAGGNLIGVGSAHDQRAEAAHLRVQQADGVVLGVVRAERVGTHQFGQPLGPMGVGHPYRSHFVQHHTAAGIGHLPGGFRASKAGANDMDGVGGVLRSGGHGSHLEPDREQGNLQTGRGAQLRQFMRAGVPQQFMRRG